MKKAITFWIEDDADIVAFCGTIAIKRSENVQKDHGADGLQMLNLSPKDLKDEIFLPIKGKAKEVRDRKVVEE